MLMKIDTYVICPKCKGIGIAQTQKGKEDPCQMCEGQGGVKNGFIDITMIMDKLDEIGEGGQQ